MPRPDLHPVLERELNKLLLTPCLFAFDFDGTLAPIRRDPSRSFLPDRTYRLLDALARHSPVAVISGRARADVRSRLPEPIRLVIGNHGCEGLPAFNPQGAIQISSDWKKILTRPLLKMPGTRLEDKRFTLTIHYRNAKKQAQAQSALLTLASELTPAPRVVLGKSVINLIPRGLPDKGRALRELMLQTQTSRALYVGDDATDEDVFRLKSRQVLGIRIGNDSHSAARHFLEKQSAINGLLELFLKES